MSNWLKLISGTDKLYPKSIIKSQKRLFEKVIIENNKTEVHMNATLKYYLASSIKRSVSFP